MHCTWQNFIMWRSVMPINIHSCWWLYSSIFVHKCYSKVATKLLVLVHLFTPRLQWSSWKWQCKNLYWGTLRRCKSKHEKQLRTVSYFWLCFQSNAMLKELNYAGFCVYGCKLIAFIDLRITMQEFYFILFKRLFFFSYFFYNNILIMYENIIINFYL